MAKNLTYVIDGLPTGGGGIDPELLDDNIPAMTCKKAYELVNYIVNGGECPELLFRINGVHMKGKL